MVLKSSKPDGVSIIFRLFSVTATIWWFSPSSPPEERGRGIGRGKREGGGGERREGRREGGREGEREGEREGGSEEEREEGIDGREVHCTCGGGGGGGEGEGRKAEEYFSPTLHCHHHQLHLLINQLMRQGKAKHLHVCTCT